MKGLIVWAQSDCRSAMGLYESIARRIGAPSLIALWFYRDSDDCIDNRMAIGFCAKEFSHVKTVPVGEDYEKGLALLNEHPGYAHIFTVYQGSAAWRRLIIEARRRGEKVVVACESPCNMAKGYRKFLKEIYLRFVLKWKVWRVIKSAECFVNYSGNDDKYARQIGWSQEKIIPFGYFPPAIPGGRFVRRLPVKPFRILASGVLSKCRGSDVVLEALRLLKGRGVDYTATITQDGELFSALKAKARRYNLPVDFTGYVEMPRLIRLYETCSVYVGAGRSEPWGIRLNDALNCGAPIVVSRGMGGVKMVDDYGCGLSFASGNAKELADCLERMIKDDDLYEQCAVNVCRAVESCNPEAMAEFFVRNVIDKHIIGRENEAF